MDWKSVDSNYEIVHWRRVIVTRFHRQRDIRDTLSRATLSLGKSLPDNVHVCQTFDEFPAPRAPRIYATDFAALSRANTIYTHTHTHTHTHLYTHTRARVRARVCVCVYIYMYIDMSLRWRILFYPRYVSIYIYDIFISCARTSSIWTLTIRITILLFIKFEQNFVAFTQHRYVS